MPAERGRARLGHKQKSGELYKVVQVALALAGSESVRNFREPLTKPTGDIYQRELTRGPLGGEPNVGANCTGLTSPIIPALFMAATARRAPDHLAPEQKRSAQTSAPDVCANSSCCGHRHKVAE